MSDMPGSHSAHDMRKPPKHGGFVVELRGLEPLTPTLPARVTCQIWCSPVPLEITTSR